MSFKKDSTVGTLVISVAMCVVCGLIVAAAAVSLRPQQQANMLLDRQTNILRVAGIYEPGMDVGAAFATVEQRFVDFKTGEYVERSKQYDQYAAANIEGEGVALTEGQDVAGIRRVANVGTLYLVNNDAGELQTIVIPIQGYGLWSTMYGYVSLENDGNTIKGIVFYRHGETPGLGGEISNPNWQALWAGKKVFDADGNLQFSVVKGHVDPAQAGAEYKVDGLSGATLTTNGVNNTVHFWFGDMAYGPYLKRYAAQASSVESM